MKIGEVRERAYGLGMQGVSRIKKAELIRAIQLQEGHQACFGADWRFSCPQLDCCWRRDCQVKRPG